MIFADKNLVPAPNALSTLKAKLKSLLNSKKSKKTAEPAAAAAAAPVVVAATATPVPETTEGRTSDNFTPCPEALSHTTS
jgi:hypothetical protein